MLSRRHLRIKTLQAIYAFYQSNSDSLPNGEKFLLKSIDKLYELYINHLTLLVDLVGFVEERLEEGKKKFFPTEDDLKPNLRFVNNLFVKQLEENEELGRRRVKVSINWREEINLLIKIYGNIKEGKAFDQYMNSPHSSYKRDKEFISSVIIDQISDLDILRQIYEDRSMFWSDADFDISLFMVLKTINTFKQHFDPDEPLPGIYKDYEDDRDFMIQLFRKTILKGDEMEQLIENKAKNWELDRIAVMDMIILKMALTEILEFPSIPVKVSINEYIELSKIFSTEKSKLFINGILDKLIIELKDKDMIKKSGRGLLSN
jgi:N utilization substance protein B